MAKRWKQIVAGTVLGVALLALPAWALANPPATPWGDPPDDTTWQQMRAHMAQEMESEDWDRMTRLMADDATAEDWQQMRAHMAQEMADPSHLAEMTSHMGGGMGSMMMGPAGAMGGYGSFRGPGMTGGSWNGG